MNLFIARLRNPGLTYSMDWHFSTLFEPPSHTTPFLYLCDLTNIHTPVHASKETWGSLPYLRMEKPGIEPLTLSAHQITYCRLFKKPKVWDTELTGLLEKDSFVVRAGDCCIPSSKKKSSGVLLKCHHHHST